MLSKKQETKLKNMPIIETKFQKSKDGAYVIQRTIISVIRPTAYYEAIVANKQVQEELFNEEELKEMIEA